MSKLLSDLNSQRAEAYNLSVSVSPAQLQKELLSALDATFTLIDDKSFAQLVHFNPRSEEPFQRWFRYRESYAPELVERAMGSLRIPCTHVLDPFCGVGSTLVAARKNGVQSIGIDVNPIVTAVAHAKTRNYRSEDIRAIESAIATIFGMDLTMPQAPRPALSILDKMFRPDVLDALLTSRYIIESHTDDKTRQFLLVGWLAILERVSNVFKEGNGIKYRNRKRTPHGYVTVPWEDLPTFQLNGWSLVRDKLTDQYRMMLEDIAVDCADPIPTIIEDSAISAVPRIERNSTSLCIFSPPYCNNFNYMKIFKVELWMGGFVETYGDMRAISQMALRSHVEMRLEIPDETDLPGELHDLLSLVDLSGLWNAKIPTAVVTYFLDMQAVLEGIWNSLQLGGECHIVVGNSAYGGVIIPTDVLLAKIASRIGFSVDRVVVARHLTTSSQQRTMLQDFLGFLRESIVILRKLP